MFGIEEKKQKKKNIKKIIYISCLVIIMIIIIGFGLYLSYEKKYESIKLDKSKELIYTRYKKKQYGFTTKVPMININDEISNELNKEIADLMNEFLAIKRNITTYKYDINRKKDILSVVLIMIDNNTETTPEFKFKVYNINLKTLKLISNKEILKLYNTNETKINNSIENKFKDFYKEEVKEGYIVKEECNYNCFLSIRNINNYSDNINYYIHNNKLYTYKEFNPYSIYGEEEYYTLDDFMFYIKD